LWCLRYLVRISRYSKLVADSRKPAAAVGAVGTKFKLH
jgi:hypothetical protein